MVYLLPRCHYKHGSHVLYLRNSYNYITSYYLSGKHIPAKLLLQIFVYYNQWLAVDGDTLIATILCFRLKKIVLATETFMPLIVMFIIYSSQTSNSPGYIFSKSAWSVDFMVSIRPFRSSTIASRHFCICERSFCRSVCIGNVIQVQLQENRGN